MKVWTIANQKGGVGKTTSVTALAGILAERSQRVLMLDCDPHASLTSYFGFDGENLEYSLFNWFLDYPVCKETVLKKIIKLPQNHLHFMPASLSLATLDKNFSQKQGMGLVIKKTLDLIADDYDYILIDCPPVLGLLLVNALAACEQLIIPVQTEFLAIKGLERMMNTLKMVIKAQHHSIEYCIVPTMFDKRTRESIQALRNMRDQFPDSLWDKKIPVDTKFRDASRQHQVPSVAFPETHGVSAYLKLADYLLEKENRLASAL